MASSDPIDPMDAQLIADEVLKLYGCKMDDPLAPELAARVKQYVLFRIDQLRGFRKDPPPAREKSASQLWAAAIKRVESPIEEILAEALLEEPALQSLFVCQYEIGPYRADIAFPDHKYLVECDGQDWHRRDPAQITRDQARDRYLAKLGWVVRRFSGSMIWNQVEFCVDTIFCEVLGMDEYLAHHRAKG